MLAFASTHAAITAQRALEGRVPFLTMPVLREVSASCGIALRVPPEHLGAIRAALEPALLPREYTLYAVTGGGRDLQAEKL